MKTFVALLLFVTLSTSTASLCNELKIMNCFDQELNTKVNGQINVEMTGHYTYLYMAQLFEHHTRHYPKVAKYFRAKAAEELSHAERFIEYQNQRGGSVEMDSVSRHVAKTCDAVDTVEKAFRCAMELEAYVTSQLTQLHNDVMEIKKGDCDEVAALEVDDLKLAQPMLLRCTTSDHVDATTSLYSNCNCGTITSIAYVELAEMIAHEFLDHQVEDTKEIANHYRNIKKLNDAGQGALGDYLFDKHLEL